MLKELTGFQQFILHILFALGFARLQFAVVQGVSVNNERKDYDEIGAVVFVMASRWKPFCIK